MSPLLELQSIVLRPKKKNTKKKQRIDKENSKRTVIQERNWGKIHRARHQHTQWTVTFSSASYFAFQLWNGLQHDATLLVSLFTCASLLNQLPSLVKFTDSPYNHHFAEGVHVFLSRRPGIHLDWNMDFWVAVDCSISPNSILSRYLNNNLIQNWIWNTLIEKWALLSVQVRCVTAGVSEWSIGSSLYTSCTPRQG